ncbi:MAG: hypothetical protein NW226_07145 [Microscillaceae bacterium]|nr:hypothetical protein [Microscillaceae bacterium]
MHTFYCNLCLFLIILLLPASIYGQGCSDAGFCSMGAMKPDQQFSKKLKVRLRSIEISQYVGRTKFEAYVYATNLDINVGLNEKTTLQFKVPYMYTTGSEGWHLDGVGDISLSLTRNLINRENFQLNATLGAKIPTNSSNELFNGLPLPMYYQTSLGTYDLILGLSLITRKWLFAFGYQEPLNANENQFTHSAWADHPRAEDAQIYPQSPLLRRSSDIMFRVERNFRFSRFSFNIGLLPIYRFKNDRVTFPNEEEIRTTGSNGLALSLLFGAAYRFSVKSQVKLLFGDRLFERQYNPDGLSREQVFSAGYVFSF